MPEIPYAPPLRDIEFVLHELLDVLPTLARQPSDAPLTRPALDTLLRELADFAQTQVAPLNASGDREGCRYEDGTVHTPTGFRATYAQFCERGWAGLSALQAHGGRALPTVIANLVTELFGCANHSWLMYGSMSRGAYECIRANGTPAQQQAWLPALASGRWTGSMCITEAEAGTDVGLLQTTATPLGDGRYRLSGLKRMATNAEHDLADNILHLVLARIKGAPAGSKGLSLFVVPKFLPAEGGPGPRNGVRCEGLEDKMGIRGTPTCWMRFDGAEGELLGAPNQGLAAMFVMMNVARISTGMQGVNQGERALQLSRDYALTRRQGRAASGATEPHAPADPLIVHADVRRMLLTQKAWVEGGRAFAYWVALLVDQSQGAPEAETRQDARELVALLTPVLKAFCSDQGHLCATLGQQVLGGWGYLRESGASQFVADARVAQIYEGANGIQGADLLGRKVLGDRGARLQRLLARVRTTCEAAAGDADLAPMAAHTRELADALEALTQVLARRCAEDPQAVGAAAHAYLRLVGHLVHAWLWLRTAQVAQRSLHADGASRFHQAKLATARFHFAHLYPEAHHWLTVARAPSDVLMALTADDF